MGSPSLQAFKVAEKRWVFSFFFFILLSLSLSLPLSSFLSRRGLGSFKPMTQTRESQPRPLHVDLLSNSLTAQSPEISLRCADSTQPKWFITRKP